VDSPAPVNRPPVNRRPMNRRTALKRAGALAVALGALEAVGPFLLRPTARRCFHRPFGHPV
jgi:hypothetical protein